MLNETSKIHAWQAVFDNVLLYVWIFKQISEIKTWKCVGLFIKSPWNLLFLKFKFGLSHAELIQIKPRKLWFYSLPLPTPAK